ncbi:MAG: dihydropteroate synthase-like protein [Candidatus Lokiarchaeota archaeon]
MKIKILIITGDQSFKILQNVTKSPKGHKIFIKKAPVSISAFITQEMVDKILDNINLAQYDLVLLPGFIQWDSSKLEEKFSISIRKGSEFASDLPLVLQKLDKNEITLSNTFPADRLIEVSGFNQYKEIFNKNFGIAVQNLGYHTFYVNKEKSSLIIGRDMPPLIIAEIVNCTEKSNRTILKKVKHYIESGADIIDIGCVANKPNPKRVKEVITLIRNNFDVLISVDSMESQEIIAATEKKIDMILSLDFGNYLDLLSIPHDIPVVILPTNIKEGYFPKGPKIRTERLLELTKKLRSNGFTKIIVDPLLETPISPGIVNSLESYFYYKNQISKEKFKNLESPLFFGISNVVELMDVDSVGINGLLASIATELNVGILFTVEHSTKMFGGVKELKDGVILNYLSKSKNTPPINVGIQIFKAKGKTSQKIPEYPEKEVDDIIEPRTRYKADPAGYFKIFVNHYKKRIFLLFYNNQDKLLQSFSGKDAEILSKKIIELNLTQDPFHIIYLGRELKKAEICLEFGKPYIQDTRL